MIYKPVQVSCHFVFFAAQETKHASSAKHFFRFQKRSSPIVKLSTFSADAAGAVVQRKKKAVRRREI